MTHQYRRFLLAVCLQIAVAFFCAPVFAAKTEVDAKPVKPVAAEKIRVTFLNPASQSANELWWQVCTNFMQAAANDLGVELTVYYANRSPAQMYQEMTKALSGPLLPDFIVMQNMKKTAPELISMAEKKNVKVMLFNSGLSDDEISANGGPREKHKNWIGQILPDDAQAGYELANIIVSAAKKKGLADANGKVEMLALGGTVSDSSAIERNKGLMRFVQEHAADVVLNQGAALPGDWENAKAASVFENAFNTYPKTTAIWNANDNMAMGVLAKARDKFGKIPGQNIIIGGIDWNPENLEAIKAGEITATLGGHFMEGAWVIVLLSDYARGVDFKTEGVSLKSQLGTITKDNIDAFERALGDRSLEKIDKIDFTKFSKASNPSLKKYKFGLNEILGQLQ